MRATDGVTGGTSFSSAGSGSTAEALRAGAAFAGCPGSPAAVGRGVAAPTPAQERALRSHAGAARADVLTGAWPG